MEFKKVVLGALILVGIVIILSLSSHFLISYQKMKTEKKVAQAYQKNSFTPEEVRQDIAFFQDLLNRVHPNPVSAFPLNDIRSELENLINSIRGPLTRTGFYQQLAPIISSINDDHTNIYPPEPKLSKQSKANEKLFPFTVRFIDNRLYISKNISDEPLIKAGMEIVSINGIPSESLRTTLISYYSGTRDAQKLFYLQEHFSEALFFGYGFSDRFELICRQPDRDTKSNYIVSGKVFSHPKPKAFHYEVDTPDSILFTYNEFEDENGTFGSFLKEMFTAAQKQNIKHLIIDLRKNEGGTTAYGDDIFVYLTKKTFTQISTLAVTISKEIKDDFISNAPSFIRWLPIQYFHPYLKPLWTGKEGEVTTIPYNTNATLVDNSLRFENNVYLLVGPGIMSSGSLFTSTMKKYNIGVLIGESPGGYATCYGNIFHAYLPNTGLKVRMPTTVVKGNSVGPIVPDHIVKQTVHDLIKNEDTVLEFTRKLIQTNQ